MMGLAELGAGRLDAAEGSFEGLRSWQKRERILMDWIWRMPLQLGTIELLLARGDVAAARRESELFQALASATAERTWTALAHYERANVAAAERDEATAYHEILRGLAVIEGCKAPLAEWRLHALAARLGLPPAHRSQAQSVVLRLANSLPEADDLRKCFLSSAPVLAVCDRSQRAEA